MQMVKCDRIQMTPPPLPLNHQWASVTFLWMLWPFYLESAHGLG